MAITKQARRVLLVTLAIWATFGSVAPGLTQQPSFEELAKRVVGASIGVKPGDVVVVNGGKHNLALMEDLAIEANKAGGMTTMMISTDKVDRSFNVDVPEAYLEQEPKYFVEWLKHVNVWIGLPNDEDNKAVIDGVPEKRFAKAAKAGQIVTDSLMNTPGLRVVGIGYPTKEDAAALHVDFDTYSKMHWKAVNADYSQISAKGKALQDALRGAKAVHVTSPAGTDITFAIGDRAVYLNDGILTPEKMQSKSFLERSINLPDGRIFGSGIETSANGKVVVPKQSCRYDPMPGISFEFKDGKMQNFKAAKNGECFVSTMAPYDGPKDMFAQFSIGLNPEMKVIEDGDADFRPGFGEGVVYITVGDNQLLGGKNKTQASWWFPILDSTVTVDGKVILKGGKIIL